MDSKIQTVFEKISRKCKGKKLVKTAMSAGAAMGLATVPLFMLPTPKDKVTSITTASGKTPALKEMINLPKKR